jgi:hypothetical protein
MIFDIGFLELAIVYQYDSASTQVGRGAYNLFEKWANAGRHTYNDHWLFISTNILAFGVSIGLFQTKAAHMFIPAPHI